MQAKLHWGLLSTARINRAVIPGLKSSPRNQLFAVASRSLQKAEEYAREWDIQRAYGSYEELLNDPDVHVIYNPLPNDLHAPWTIRACEAGKHVLCEKPIALSTNEVDAIAAAARDNGVTVAEAFMYRYHPQTEAVQRLVAEGWLGEIQLMRGTFTFPLNRPEDYRWKPEAGGGSLWDVGCYPVSYARMLSGEPPIEVMGWQVESPSGVDLVFAGQLRYSSGLLVQVSSAFNLPVHSSFEVRGTEGSLFIQHPFKSVPDAEVLLVRGEDVERLTFPAHDIYLGEIENLADAIFEKKQPRLTLDESRENIATLSALLESARKGMPIRM